ncbi:MAG: hypothetical protein ACRELD_07330 [Longimicrobiales bacterium]
MAGNRLSDAREDARRAVERYDALDRKRRMDEQTLKRHALEIRDALASLVGAADGSGGDVESRTTSAREALDEFDDPARYADAQHVRRACYVLRERTTSLLDATTPQ